MYPVGFEPAFPVSERPQTHALDRMANGIGDFRYRKGNFSVGLATSGITDSKQSFKRSVWA